ncbi:Ig-like domain-containing protein [Enterobacter mori]|uniref:Ig-like domain-containing protein n=1 Tax=Enterobacter mori TaxID=539813 RepID=UPI001EDB9CF0|nr:Ig-like domain-containing protein [Enterobacter mori]UKJ22798.1 Ig-like domain-containing protein [Enterobacter mori]
MKLKTRKIFACIQIVLQLLPPSTLLYISPVFNASAEDVNSTQKQQPANSSDQRESGVAQAAVQAGSLLSSDNATAALGSAVVSAATGKAASSVQEWLSQFGTARVNISTDEHFTLSDSDLDLLVPLYNGKENLFFTQLGGRRHDDRNIINGGLGYRHFNDDWMWGTNVFYDRQVSGNQHQRLGLGSELGWDYLKVSANGYLRLSNWMSSSRYEDYDERAANGFDISATGYLPAYPQLGANVIYEQYYGDSVGLFGDDEDDRQKDPYAVTLGLNYTPVPLVTMGLNHKMGKSGENDTQINLALTWTPGVPLSAQLDPSQVALRRTLQGGRMDLVDRNNNIVLEYRKQELISLSVPSQLEGAEQSKQTVTAKVKAKHGLDRIEWQGDSFFSHGGKISAGGSPEQFVMTLPVWQGSSSNSYTLSATAWDKNGNASKPDQMQVTVNGIDVSTLQSTTSVSPATVPADGASTATVSVTLKTSTGEAATGLATRLTATLTSSAKTTNSSSTTDKAPKIASFSENGSGVYIAILTSGTIPDTLTIQPLIDGTTKLATAKLIEEATVLISQLTTLEQSATSALASGSAPITLTSHVTDQYGQPFQGATINWSADNAQAVLSEAQTSTDESGTAKIQLSSKDIITTVVTAQLERGNALKTPSLTFTADASTAKVTTISSEKQQVVANNNDTDTVTAQVTDNYSHPLSGVTVNWTVEKTDDTPVATKTSTTDSSGNAVLALKSSKTGTITVSAEVKGTSPQETDPIAFVADASTQTVSEITLSKQKAVANGSDSITYEATVTDAQGNTVEGATVNWSADNSDAKLSAAQTTSDSRGVSQITVTSLKAGTVVVSAGTSSTAMKLAGSAAFTADSSSAMVTTLTSDRQSALANGTDSIVLSATVIDANGNPLQNADVSWRSDPATGQLSASTTATNASGVATVTLMSQDVSTYSVTAGINSTTKTLSGLGFIADTSTAHLEKLSSSANSVLADGKTAITLTANVVEQSGHPVKGEQINWSADNDKAQLSVTQSVTDEQGQVQIQVTSSDITTTVVTAQHNQAEALKTGTLSFTGDTASAKVASINSEKTQVVANNIDTDTVTAQVHDSYNHPLSGVTVNWSAANPDGSSVKSSTSVTDSQGNATWTLKSAKTGVVTVSAAVSGTQAKETGQITFVADSSSASVSLLTLDKTQATANGSDSITYTATVLDAQGNAVQGATIDWSADSAAAKLSGTQSTSGADGTSQITVTSLKAGDIVITAQTSEATAKQADKATFVADASTAIISAITSDKTSVLANGSDAITVSATVTDANGNLLSESDVNWAASPADGKLSAESSKTNASGVAQVQLTSDAVEKYAVTASVNGSTSTVSDLSFTADSSTAQVATLTADKTVDIVADKDTVALTAQILDAQQHPVSGVVVNWSSSESNSSFSINSSVSDAQGQATVTFSSLKAGSIDVTATSGTSTKSQKLEVVGNVDTAQVAQVIPDKSDAVADGVATVMWTAKVVDANANVLEGISVNWSANSSDVVLSATSSASVDGEATVNGTSLKSGSVVVTASLTSPSGQTSATPVSFTADLKTAKVITITPSTDHVAAGTEAVNYTALIQDANDNPVEGASVSWATTLNTLSASESSSNSNGEAMIELSGSEFGPQSVTASINGSSLTNDAVIFTGTIEASWDIPDGTQSSVYKGQRIDSFKNLGFIVKGTTTGPTSLIWTHNYGAWSVLTAPLTDEDGITHTITLRGQVVNACTEFEFNNGSGCESPGNAPKLTFNPEDGDNANLPAGKYTGVITFDGKDWHTSWALNYIVSTTLTVH